MKRILCAVYYTLSLYFLVLFFIKTFFVIESSAGLRLSLLLVSAATGYIASRVLSRTCPDRRYVIMKSTFIGLFLIYIFFLCDLVLFDTYFGRSINSMSELSFAEYIDRRVNLIPFSTIIGFFDRDAYIYSFIVNIIGNLFAFAPMGFFLPLLFKKIDRWYKLVLTVAVIVTAVELLQLLMRTGSCDTDDLILNTFGAYLAYIILKIPVIKELCDDITVFNTIKSKHI